MTRATLIRGDGIGPEISDATVEVMDATGAGIEWEERGSGIASHGVPDITETVASIKKNRIALKGPLATPIGTGFRSINVSLRQELDLYANLRPAKLLPGVKTRFGAVDLVVVRENTQGLYSGIEHYIDAKKDSAQAMSLITRTASERVIDFAFRYARQHGRKKVTLVHKANILKLTTGLFLQVGREVAQRYPEIGFDDRIIDATAMQLVMRPEKFDVIVTTNLFGDILSDLCAGLVGGLGLTPSGNYGEGETAIFEAVHGTAPDIAGQGIANPTALMLSGVMMLDHLGKHDQARRLEGAIRGTLEAGQNLTPDLGGNGNLRAYTGEILARLKG